MVKIMIRNNNFNKCSDFLKDDFKSIMDSYFNPFEYNLESNYNHEFNSDKIAMKSKNHQVRKNIKNSVK